MELECSGYLPGMPPRVIEDLKGNLELKQSINGV